MGEICEPDGKVKILVIYSKEIDRSVKEAVEAVFQNENGHMLTWLHDVDESIGLVRLAIHSFPESPVNTHNKSNINTPSTPNRDDCRVIFRVYVPKTQVVENYKRYRIIILKTEAIVISNSKTQKIRDIELHHYFKYWIYDKIEEIIEIPDGIEVEKEVWLRFSNSVVEPCFTRFMVTFAVAASDETDQYVHPEPEEKVTLVFNTKRTKPKQFDRVKQKQTRKKLNYTTTTDIESGEEFSKIKTLKEKTKFISLAKDVAKISKTGFLQTRTYYKLMNEFERLGENSEEMLYAKIKNWKDYFIRKNNIDGLIITLIEESGVHFYKNKKKEAREVLKQVETLLPKSTNVNHLAARSKYLLTAIEQKDKNLGTAHNAVMHTKYLLEGVEPCEDTADALYHEAKLQREQCAAIFNCSIGLRKDVVTILEMALRHFMQEPRGYCDNEIRRCFLAMSQAYLGYPLSHQGRGSNNITSGDIQEAEKCMDAMKEHYWTDVTKRNEMTLLMTECGLLYRKQLYKNAREKAVEAKDIASYLEFEREVEECDDFITFLKPYCHKSTKVTNSLQKPMYIFDSDTDDNFTVDSASCTRN